MTKPFSIQSPETLAKEYGGNKQKLAEAMQMGVVDPTAGVLAGMFIDRMRAAQVLEATPQATVAQQVMGGAPPAPAAAPPMGPGPSQAAPPMAPMAAPQLPMGMPMPGGAPMGEAPMPMPEAPMGGAPMGEAPIGMADGGLASLDIPDTMFDEPSNGGFDDGYAGGGMVAFADGGDIDAERLRRALLMQESSGDYGAVNEGSGAMGAYQFMEPTARALAKRLGMEYRPELMKGTGGRSKAGREYQERLMDAQMKDILAFADGDVGRAGIYHFAGPNEASWGPKTREYKQDILQRYSGSKDSGGIPERDIGTAQGRFQSPMDIFTALQAQFGPTKDEQEVDAARMARAKEMASDEYYEKQRKSDMWQTLAEIGFNMASSKSPYLLQAIGEAAAASMPGARADKKERQELKNRALDAMAAMNGMKRKENLQLYSIAVESAKAGMEQENFEAQMGLKREELDLAERKLDTELAIAMAKGEDPKDRVVRYMLDFPKGSPEYEAASNYLEKTRSSTSSGALTPEQIRANVEAGRGGGGGGVIDFSALTPPK